MEGYAKVAQFMAKYDEFAIFRGFRTLNVQNLLYLQAEIIHLEESLARLVQCDAEHPGRELYAHDWWTLAHGESKSGRKQWKEIEKLRKKLDEYNDNLLKQVFLSKLQSPTSVDLYNLRSWLERPSMGAFPIRGLDMTAWENTGDLIAVKPRVAEDVISRWTTNILFPLYHKILGERFKRQESPELGKGIYNYKESVLALVVNIFATVVASLLPLLSIVMLFIIQSNELKLGIITIFSACFSLALTSMTNARRIEIFAATAAFAAVNVVFLTNNSPVIVTCDMPSDEPAKN